MRILQKYRETLPTDVYRTISVWVHRRRYRLRREADAKRAPIYSGIYFSFQLELDSAAAAQIPSKWRKWRDNGNCFGNFYRFNLKVSSQRDAGSLDDALLLPTLAPTGFRLTQNGICNARRDRKWAKAFRFAHCQLTAMANGAKSKGNLKSHIFIWQHFIWINTSGFVSALSRDCVEHFSKCGWPSFGVFSIVSDCNA